MLVMKSDDSKRVLILDDGKAASLKGGIWYPKIMFSAQEQYDDFSFVEDAVEIEKWVNEAVLNGLLHSDSGKEGNQNAECTITKTGVKTSKGIASFLREASAEDPIYKRGFVIGVTRRATPSKGKNESSKPPEKEDKTGK